jgi:hypothetical protein
LAAACWLNFFMGALRGPGRGLDRKGLWWNRLKGRFSYNLGLPRAWRNWQTHGI